MEWKDQISPDYNNISSTVHEQSNSESNHHARNEYSLRVAIVKGADIDAVNNLFHKLQEI